MAMLFPTSWMAVLLAVALLSVYLYNRLRYLRRVQHAGFPQIPFSLIWGDAPLLAKFPKEEPDRHSDYGFEEVWKKLGCPPVFLMDLRPFNPPLLVVTKGEVAEQITKATKLFPWSVNKSPTMGSIQPLIGEHSILTQEGEDWKGLRRRFNPGFAPQHLLRLLPTILDKTQFFLGHLDRFAQTGEPFSLAELVINLTFDIIGSVVMDADLNAQLPREQQNPIITEYRNLLHSYKGALALWPSPQQLFKRWRAARRAKALIRAHVIKTFYREQQTSKATKSPSSRSILSLSLQGLETLDPLILDATCDQLRSFLLAGHDTTSILLQWTIYELSRTPRVLAILRREMGDLFGADDPSPEAVRARLLGPGGEDLVSKMPYTSAVIKETLRLYPPAGSARMPPQGKGMTLTLPDGSRTPCIDGIVIYPHQYQIQRDPEVYGDDAEDWVPERWLGNSDTWMSTNSEDAEDEKSTASGNKSGIPASAWRPFERGPRNCIGQELANIESRVILACVVRKFDFVKVGLGEVTRDPITGEPILNAKGQYEVARRLYNTQQITAKPVDGTMMKVKLATR